VDEGDERNERNEKPERPPAEGVRIIGAEEAQAALERGQAAGRRPDDELKFGDVPPAPTGPRSPHRFPLPATADPATAVPRSPVIPPEPAGRPAVPPVRPMTPPSDPPVRPFRSDEAASHGDEAANYRDDYRSNSGDGYGDDSPAGEPGGADPTRRDDSLTVSGPAELPHWTEPPTGEVPRILSSGDPGDQDDDMAVWSGITARTPRWRDQQADWAEGDFDDVSDLVDEDSRVGVLDPTRSEHSDIYSFDEPAPPVPPPGPVDEDRSRRGTTPISSAPERGRREREPVSSANGGGRDLGTAVAVGVGLVVLALLALSLGPVWALVLATAVVLACALELFNVFQRAGYRPATLLGGTATVALMFGAYWKLEVAIPLILVMTLIVAMLWYMIGVVRARPTVNVAMTMLGVLWVGTFGAYAALLLKDHGHHPNHGVGLLWGAVLTTVAYDVVGYLIGSRIGRTPLAPEISPNKTWEGFISGAVASAIIGGVLVGSIYPWHAGSGLKLGLLVGFFIAPLGDLCESMIKRDIGVKDMGNLLPGHGGMLDRFDSLLFVLPATYYLAQYLRLG
jgi:phosphatidate cytidylyltransferase